MMTKERFDQLKANCHTDDKLQTYVLSDIREMLSEIARLRAKDHLRAMALEASMASGEPPEGVTVAVARCSGCGMIHIGVLDAEDDPIAEMSFDDDDTVRLASQLLHAVNPAVTLDVVVAQLKIITEIPATDARH